MSPSHGFSTLLFTGALLLADPVSALSTVYDMAGSTMRMNNQVCSPCTVAVSGTVTLDDDGAGNVVLTDLNLAHAAYQVGNPAVLSIEVERSSILLGAGSVAGVGSTLTLVAFGSTTIAQSGTVSCTPMGIGCDLVGLPVGVTAFADSHTVNLGMWTFDALGGFEANFKYMTVTSPPAIEFLNLVGTPVPEPGSGVLLAIGTILVAAKRRQTLAATPQRRGSVLRASGSAQTQ